MKKIFIIGHKSPDLDAIAAPIVYAHFLKKIQRYGTAILVPVSPSEINAETTYVLKKLKIDIPKNISEYEINERDEFILIDHNEISQRSEFVVDAKVIEVVDHHKINVNFTRPVRITVMPLGASCSVIYDQMKVYRVRVSPKISRLVLNAILSDTQGLKANTTTGIDSGIAHEISRTLSINIDEEIYELFKAKSNIDNLSLEEIALKDYKIFDFSGKKVLINQIETVDPNLIIQMKDQLVQTMREIKVRDKLDYIYTAITDLIAVNTALIYTDDQEQSLIKKAFITQPVDNFADIGPKMSRKKDIAPALEQAITTQIA